MQKDLNKMAEQEYRDTVFIHVFNSAEGEMVLDWLDRCYKIVNPDTQNPNDVYYRLGKQSVITHIRNIIKNAKEKK